MEENFLSNILTLSVGLFIWLVKDSYEKYKKELTVISKTERVCVQNLAALHDNIYLLDGWINAIKNKEHYSCIVSKLEVYDESSIGISDMELTNKIFKLFFQKKRLNDDLENLYIRYRENVRDFIDKKTTEDQINIDNISMMEILIKIRPKIIELQELTIESIAHLRIYNQEKIKTFFRIVKLLNTKIGSKITKPMIDKEGENIKKELKDSIINS